MSTPLLGDPASLTAPAVQVLSPERLEYLGVGDRCVQEIMVLMTMGEWDGSASYPALVAKYNVKPGSIQAYAAEAGRHLRIQNTPDAILTFCLAKLREVIEQSEPDRVPAIKTLLDQLDRIEKRRGNRPQDKLSPEQERERLCALLDDPPPALVEILEAKWGPRR